MKLLFVLLFLGSPVFACKLVPGSALKGEETAAINAVKKQTSAQHVKAKGSYGKWIVRTTKPTCVEYEVETKRHPDCKVTAEIVKDRPCP